MIQAGRKASISIVGAPVAMTAEPMRDISLLQDGSVWQITDPLKRLINKNSAFDFYFFDNTATAITGTTTTTIKITGHGLLNGDAIVNLTRANAWRVVTKVDDNTITVSSIVGQTIGDNISGYINIDRDSYPPTMNLTNGIIDYGEGNGIMDATFKVSASYLPKTLVATANDYSYNQATEMGDVTPFLATHKKRMPLLKYTSGTLSYWDITDPYFTDALIADTPKYIVLEDGTSQKALLAYFDKTELKASIGSPQSMTVGFISANGEVG